MNDLAKTYIDLFRLPGVYRTPVIKNISIQCGILTGMILFCIVSLISTLQTKAKITTIQDQINKLSI